MAKKKQNRKVDDKKNREERTATVSSDKIEVEWTIVRALPNLVFDIQLPEDFWWSIIKGYLSWKMRIHFIKLIEWDKVIVELSQYDLTKWRIVFRKQ